MVEYANEQKRQTTLQKRKDLEARLAKVRAREKRQQELYENGEPRFKKPVCPLSLDSIILCVWSNISRKQIATREPLMTIMVRHNFSLANMRVMKNKYWGIQVCRRVYQLQRRGL